MNKKTNPILTKCPVCSENLFVTTLACDHCQTKIEGNFHLSKFNYLEQEQLYFIELFIKNRGNIKAIEKELNMSYPTVKKMLDDVIIELGYKIEDDVEETETPHRSKILEQLEKKELTVLEALSLLKKGK